MDPTNLIEFFLLSMAKLMEKKEANIPDIINPALKIRATLDTPKSLRALFVQLNHGERAIEILMDRSANTGVKIPNHAATFGSIIFLHPFTIDYTQINFQITNLINL